MSYMGSSSTNEDASGNIWSSGSHGGSRTGYSHSSNYDDNRPQEGGSYRGSFGNNNSRRDGGGGGGYGFRRQNNDRGEVEIQTDTIFIQDLPKSITRDQILDIFSTVGSIKIDDRSGGPKIWIYKDRDTGEANGRATVTYEDDETANRAISQYNDQHIDSIGTAVRVQLAQRRNRNNNDRGGRGGGYRGARSNWNDNSSRQNYGSGGDRWASSGKGFSNDRSSGSGSGGGGGFRSMGGGSSSFQDADDRGSSYRGSRNGSYRGASRGSGGSSSYSPY